MEELEETVRNGQLYQAVSIPENFVEPQIAKALSGAVWHLNKQYIDKHVIARELYEQGQVRGEVFFNQLSFLCKAFPEYVLVVYSNGRGEDQARDFVRAFESRLKTPFAYPLLHADRSSESWVYDD